MSVNERQKPVIFKTLTERISRFKKINGLKLKRNRFFFQPKIAINLFKKIRVLKVLNIVFCFLNSLTISYALTVVPLTIYLTVNDFF